VKPSTPHDAPNDTGLAGGTEATSAPAASHSAEPSHALAAAVRVISGLTLLSRFSGLARDIITARIFGGGLLGSSFRAAYAAPNLFRRLFGEGALSAAFLPEYTRVLKSDPSAAQALASMVVYALCLVTGALVLLLEIVLLAIITVGNDPERELSLKLVMVMLPMMPAVCLTAILSGVLQVHGKFGPPAAAPVLLNLAQIAAALLCIGLHVGAESSTYAVGWAAVGASGLQIVWCLWALRGRVRWTRAFRAAGSSGRTVLRRFVPVVIGLGTLQLNTMIDTLIAMWPTYIGPTMFGRAVTLDESSNAVISYAQTIYQFPLGVFGIAVATAVFPLLSRTASDPAAFLLGLRRGLRLSLFIGLPASIGLFIVRHDLIRTIFGGSERAAESAAAVETSVAAWEGFTEPQLVRMAAALAGFAPAVWAYSLNHVFSRAFYAKGDTTTPMRVAIGMVVLNLTLNFVLIWPLREAGLAWATAISATVQCGVLFVLCARLIAAPLVDRETAAAGLRTILVSAVMGLGVWAVARWLPLPETWIGTAARLTACVFVGAVLYSTLSLAMRSPEFRWLRERAPRGARPPGDAVSFE